MSLNTENEYGRYHRSLFNLRKITQGSKNRSYLWLSLTIFTVCFFLILAIQPTLVTIAKLNKEIQDKTEASQKLQTKINSIVAAQNEFAKNSENFSLLDDALPEKSEFPRLAFFFEEIATSSGVSLNSLSFDGIEESVANPEGSVSPGTRQLNFSITVSGDYPKLRDFLITLESSRRILKIEKSTFNQAKKEDIVELSLSVRGQTSYGKVR